MPALGATGTTPRRAGATGGRRRIDALLHPPRWLRIALSIVIVALLAWLVVIPDYRLALGDLRSLESLSVPLLVVAGVLEAASLLVFSGMTSAALRPTRVAYSTLLAIDLTDLAVNHVVPGGGTTSAAVRYGLLTRIGVRHPDALAAAAIEVTVANLMLGGLFATGLVLSIAAGGESSNDTLALWITGVFALGAVAAAWILVRHGSSAARASGALVLRVTRRDRLARQAHDLVATFADRVVLLFRDPRRLAAMAVLGIGNWALDAGALAIVLLACGHAVSPGLLLTVYGVGSLLAMLPLTPGGLGIVEGVMVPALVVGGVPADAALVGVIAWRVLEFWLPIPVGGAAALWLRLRVLPHR